MSVIDKNVIFVNMKQLVFILFVIATLTTKVLAVDYDSEFKKHGFVNVQTLDSTIVVDLKYSSTENFMGVNMYGALRKAYLRPEIAKMVVDAQRLLKEKNQDYTLVIYDAARPLSVQKSMYDKVQNAEFQQYVANPYSGGGFHNFGCAVDISILYKGVPIDMGTGFDDFTELSHIDNEEANLKNGKLSREAYDNRQLLRFVMTKVGFNTESCEWWHFDYYKKEYVRKEFKILDF